MTGFLGVDGAWGGRTVDNGHYLTSHRKSATDEPRKHRRLIQLQSPLILGQVGAYTRVRRRRKSEMRAALESLLRARKLDVTLTDAPGALAPPPERLAPFPDAPISTPRWAAACGAGICRKSPALRPADGRRSWWRRWRPRRRAAKR